MNFLAYKPCISIQGMLAELVKVLPLPCKKGEN